MQPFQWLKDVLTSPAGTPVGTPREVSPAPSGSRDKPMKDAAAHSTAQVEPARTDDPDVDLDAMMAAAETRRLEVETQASQLMSLLSRVEGEAASGTLGRGLRQKATEASEDLNSPLLNALAPDDSAVAAFGPSTAKSRDADSPLHSAAPEPALVLPPPTLSLSWPPASSAPEAAAEPSHPDHQPLSSNTSRGRSLPQSPQLSETPGWELASSSRSLGPGANGTVRQRLEEAKGRVDSIMTDVSDVRSRLGAQDQRISSLTQTLRELSEGPPVCKEAESERGRASPRGMRSRGGSRNASPSPRPAVRKLMNEMVNEMNYITELSSRGENATRQVAEARAQLQDLKVEASSPRSPRAPSFGGSAAHAALSDDHASRLLNTFRQELSDAISSLRRQELGTLRRDFDALKVQLRSVVEARGSIKQELDNVMTTLKLDLSASMSAAIEAQMDKVPAVSAPGATTELASAVSDLRDRLERTEGSALESRRSINSLQEDIAVLQTSKTQLNLDEVVRNLRQELLPLASTGATDASVASRRELTEAIGKIARDLSELKDSVHVEVSRRIQTFTSEALQEKKATEHSLRALRQELLVAIEELRSRPSTHSVACSPGSIAWPVTSPASSQPPPSPGELIDPNKDFGNLRNDLNSLKNRQEFLKQELKCLVDTAARA